MAVAVIDGAADLYVMVFASSGTMANSKPRAGVPSWFFARLVGGIVELGTAGAVLAVLFLESVSRIPRCSLPN